MSNEAEIKLIRFMDEVFDDVMRVFAFGADKHPDSGDTPNFLMEDGNKCQHKVRHDSCFHHTAESFCGSKADHESGLHPLLHLISSSAILYYRQKHGIVHPDDEEK